MRPKANRLAGLRHQSGIEPVGPADQEGDCLAALIPPCAERSGENVAWLRRAPLVKRDQDGLAGLRAKGRGFLGLAVRWTRGAAFRNFDHLETRQAQRFDPTACARSR